MANQECSKCGARFSSSDDWAKSALSTLMPAPAVRDMATQLRCPECGHVFAESEVSHLRPPLPLWLKLLLPLLVAGLLIWAFNYY
jgi:DNA-directed RNA polymerase subunit RPC12/RpoP